MPVALSGLIGFENLDSFILKDTVLPRSLTKAITENRLTLKQALDSRRGKMSFTSRVYSESVSLVQSTVATILARLESQLRKNSTLGRLGPAMLPIGSSAEGTRIGLPDEMDFTVLFQDIGPLQVALV